jgi:hypothetical protein
MPKRIRRCSAAERMFARQTGHTGRFIRIVGTEGEQARVGHVNIALDVSRRIFRERRIATEYPHHKFGESCMGQVQRRQIKQSAR